MSQRDLRFAKTHEWLRVEGETVTIGLTDYAQGELGDIVFIELPEIGKTVSVGDALATIESVKSVSEIYAPVGGGITDVNAALDDNPALVNSDPYGEGWILRMKLTDVAQLEGLLSFEEYEEHTKG